MIFTEPLHHKGLNPTEPVKAECNIRTEIKYFYISLLK